MGGRGERGSACGKDGGLVNVGDGGGFVYFMCRCMSCVFGLC